MKIAALLAVASLFAASCAAAQSAPPPANVPPPGINDPGTQAAAPADAPRPARRTALPSMHDGAAGDHAKHMSLPEVSVRQEGDSQVQEYRRSGLLYMVVVTPRNGIAQTYAVDPDGTRHLQPGEAPVRPVMYKVLEWGKSRPASAASSGSAPDDGH